MSDLPMTKGEETYRKIINGAIDIMAEEGVSGLSASKVALKSGVSKSDLVHHFKTIEEVPIAVLDTLIKDVMAPMTHMKADSVEMMFNSLESMLNWRTEVDPRTNKVFYAFYYAGMFDEAYKEVMHSFLEASKEDLACKIMNVSVREVKKSEAERYATLMMAMLDGIGLHILLGVNKEHYLNSWRLLKQVMVRELDYYEDWR